MLITSTSYLETQTRRFATSSTLTAYLSIDRKTQYRKHFVLAFQTDLCFRQLLLSLYLSLSLSEWSVARWCRVNIQCRGVLRIWIRVGQGPTALSVGADGVVGKFFLSSVISLSYLPLFGRRPDID